MNTLTDQRSEQRGEPVSNAAHELRMLREKWNIRLPLDYLRLSERYGNHEMPLLLYITVGIDPEPFLAHVQRAPDLDRGKAGKWVSSDRDVSAVPDVTGILESGNRP